MCRVACQGMPPKDEEQQSIRGETNTMRTFLAGLLTCGAFGLAGCMDTMSTDTVAATGGDLTGATATNCREAIARETNRNLGDVAIFDVLESEAGNQAQASVAGADQPWICMTDRNGVVSQVMYSGQG